jgi:hypothetical protein
LAAARSGRLLSLGTRLKIQVDDGADRLFPGRNPAMACRSGALAWCFLIDSEIVVRHFCADLRIRGFFPTSRLAAKLVVKPKIFVKSLLARLSGWIHRTGLAFFRAAFALFGSPAPAAAPTARAIAARFFR